MAAGSSMLGTQPSLSAFILGGRGKDEAHSDEQGRHDLPSASWPTGAPGPHLQV